ncbi:MAG: hypothetical protein ACTSXJ_06125 [Candidatus Baldrarchaeia archaeon]
MAATFNRDQSVVHRVLQTLEEMGL